MTSERIDLVVLSRDDGPLPAEVQRGIECQSAARVIVHRVIGQTEPSDAHRWQTIARARNCGKRLGTAPWLMFLDDDVVLAPGTIARLVSALRARPAYGALAVDYLAESGDGFATHHVAMGATLFRRSVLDQIQFRWQSDRCECRCCCDDLRRLGYGIRHAPGLRARHLRGESAGRHPGDDELTASPMQLDVPHPDARVLVALDRRHLQKFRRQFLGSLRRAGNCERVTVVTYGLYPSEQKCLERLPGVEVVPLPDSWTMPPIRRLKDFQPVVERLPAETPVAYWDAGDVFFQEELRSLWQLVRDHPDKLLAAREPRGYPRNPAVGAWCRTIRDADCRHRALELLKNNPFLNSGFAAGPACAMLDYLREAHRLRHAPDLRGTTDWGDQMALNLYCHSNPERWHEVAESWNFCVHDRPRGEVWVRADGRVSSRRGVPIHVVHGNAHSFRKLELYAL